MKVLFINSGMRSAGPQAYGVNATFPYGLGYLMAVLLGRRHDVELCDRFLGKDDWIEPDGFDVVGVSCSTPLFNDSRAIFERIGRRKGLRVIAGGPHASMFPDSFPDNVDNVVCGEAEQVIGPLVEGKIEDRLIRTERMKDIEELPMAPYDVFASRGYKTGSFFFPELHAPVWTMSTGRGCPFNCSFCSVKDIWGKKVTSFSAERIVREVGHVVETYGVRSIFFREDNFTVNEKRVRRFCELLIASGLDIDWGCESRCDTVSKDTLALMVKSGMKGLWVGVESGSRHMLDVLVKQQTPELMEDFIVEAKRLGAGVGVSMIRNHPEETRNDINQTKAWLTRVKPDHVWWSPWREEYVMPRTEKDIKVAALLGVRNEATTLAAAVESCRRHVDKVIISVDSKSEDNTAGLAKKLADVCVEHVWETPEHPHGSFAACRNRLLELAAEHGCNWGLILDGHEYLKSKPGCTLKSVILENQAADAFGTINMVSNLKVPMVRLLRISPGIRYKGDIHTVPGGYKKEVRTDKLWLYHDREGQARQYVRQRGEQRKMMSEAILKKAIEKNPRDTRSLFYLGQSYKETGRYKEAVDILKQYLEVSTFTAERWEAWSYLLVCAKNLKDDALVLESLGGAAREQDRAETWFEWGNFEYHAGRYEQALTYYRRASNTPKPGQYVFLNERCYTWAPYDMAGMAYHRLKNPLAAIRVASLALRREMPEKDRNRIVNNIRFWCIDLGTKLDELEMKSGVPHECRGYYEVNVKDIGNRV